MKSSRIHGVWIGLLLACFASAHAENAVRFSDGAGNPGDTVMVDITIENDIAIASATIPFRWSSADLILDSVIFVPDRYRGNVVTRGTASTEPQTGAILLISGYPISGWIDRGIGIVARLRFLVATGASSQWVAIDSLNESIEQGQRYVQFSDMSGMRTLLPAVYSGVVTIGSPAGRANLAAIPQRLDFVALVNGPSPPTQSLSIRAVGGPPVTWQASVTAPWLSVTPLSGRAPGDIQANVGTAGLSLGTHTDTVTISSPGAINSPLRIPVNLTVEAAASMLVSPVSLSFQRTLPAGHPPNQVLELQFSPEVSLAWTATRASSWLRLSPASGNGPGQMDIEIDSLFTDQGQHNDTIVVVATEADNSPVRIPVTLRIDTATSIPPRFSLSQNYPNPFSAVQNQTTSLSYTLSVPDHVNITVYNVLGDAVRHLVSGRYEAGARDVAWDGRDDHGRLVTSGVYFCRMKTSAGSQTRQIVLIK